jgi:hypothetical protein
MKKSNITISYDEEKLNAIRLFLTQKNLDLDTELTGVLDSLFKKHVPSSVRDFLELKDVAAPSSPAKKPAGAGKESTNG